MERTSLTVYVMMAVVVGVACPVFAQCTEIWIDQATGVNDPGTQGTPVDPFKSITYALAVAGSSGWPEPWCVYIRAGVYDADPNRPANEREIFPIELGDGMVFEGTDPNTCIIDGQHLTQGFAPLLYGNDLTGLQIRGLTFRNMDHSQGNGGAIELVNCSGLLDNCVIENCSAQSGGGLWLRPGPSAGGPFDLISCRFSANTATITGQDVYGGAVHVATQLTGDIINCDFADNQASTDGGHKFWGGALSILGSLTGTVNQCTFVDNSAYGYGGQGGGLFVSGTITGDIAGCTFQNNDLTGVGNPSCYPGPCRNVLGGGAYFQALSGALAGCVFLNNSAYTYHDEEARGGGLYCEALNGTVSGCTLIGNFADGFGGGLDAEILNGGVADCDFILNTSSSRHGGGLYVGSGLSGGIVSCNFGANAAGNNGAGFYVAGDMSGSIESCSFTNNQGAWAGFYVSGTLTGDVRACEFTNDERLLGDRAAVVVGVFDGVMENCRYFAFPELAVRLANSSATTATIRNCLLVAPATLGDVSGWAVRTSQKTSISNNTIIGPGLDPGSSPSALYFDFGTQADNSQVFNNIIMESSRAIHVAPTVDMLIQYNQFYNVDDIVCQGEQCLGNDIFWLELLLDNFRFNDYADPVLVAWPTGTWTADATYDPGTGQTTFVNDAAAWGDDRLTGLFLNPDTTEDLRALIAANAATTISVWGNFAPYATTGDTYEISDYHLSNLSPCVDAGDPNFVADPGETDIDGQPRVIDIPGVFYNGRGPVDIGSDEFSTPGDFDFDGDVDLSDFGSFAACYNGSARPPAAACPPGVDADLDDDGDVDLDDFATFAANYTGSL